MNKLILVKYAPEIFLKGLNRNKFEKKLKNNIKYVLKDVEYEFIVDQNRWFIKSENNDEVIAKVKRVFGVSEVCIVNQIERDYDTIKEEAVRVYKEANPSNFKVETKRANKDFPINSMDVNREVGAYILSQCPDAVVKVKDPEFTVQIEIRDKAYVYEKRVKAVGGLPYGINGTTMLMLSGGIDSPVAAYMMAKRGVGVQCVYYHSHPYTSERAKEKVKDLAKIVGSYTGSMRLFVVPFTNIQMSIMEKCREDELTIIMRRFMMRLACALGDKYGAQSVTTGESIGQVASQTMESIICSDDCADRPVFRPLVTSDKIDIMDTAREIGTYETSILPYEDCCTIFVPKHPKTKPRLEEIRKSESALDIDALVKEAVDNLEIIDL